MMTQIKIQDCYPNKTKISLSRQIRMILLGVFLFTGMGDTLLGDMPPHPRVLKLIAEGEIDLPYFMANGKTLMNKGVGSPWQSISNFRSIYGPTSPPVGVINALAIVVDFSDNISQVQAEFFDTLIFGSQAGSMRDYFGVISYGNLDIVTVNLPSSVGWNRAPETYSYYVNGENGFGSYPTNAQRLVEDVVNAVDALVDFSLYDNDSDGYVDALFIIHSGPGAEFTGDNNDIWSHAWVTNTEQSLDGVIVSRYSMEPEFWESPGDMTIGVYAHELGHSLFGLPDLYDRDGSSAGLGRWSFMAGGSWNGTLGDSPAFPDAWSHIQMGYASEVNITSSALGASIENVVDNSNVYRLWTSGAMGTEYFLVENRQQKSYDAALPGGGLLIYHVDEGVSTQNDNEWYPGNTGSGHYQVALEQADGLWDLESITDNFGDSGDPYPGSSVNNIFDLLSTPNSTDYSVNLTGVAVQNISSSADIMTADLFIFPGTPGIITVTPNSVGADLYTGGTDEQVITISNDAGAGTLFFDISFAPYITPTVLAATPTKSWERGKIDMSEWSQSLEPAAGVVWYNGFSPVQKVEPEKSSVVGIYTPSVLLLASDNSISNAETALISTGLFTDADITQMPFPTSITLIDLTPYDVVLVWSDNTFTNPVNIGDVLKEYVDAGGGVVLGHYAYSTSWAIQGGILDPNYSPFLPAVGTTVSGELDLSSLTVPNHPIFEDITINPTYWQNTNYSNPPLNSGGILLAMDTFGNNLVAENATGSVVGIAVYPGNLTDILANSEAYRMFANAIYYVAENWLSVNPVTGSVDPGASVDVLVTFDAFRLLGGSYDRNIVVSSNDTNNPEVTVRAHLNVTGAPDIHVSQDILEYGTTFVGYPKTLDLLVTNFGTDPLTVSSILSSNSAFMVDKSNLGLGVREFDTVKVTFDPPSVGDYNWELTFSSDDPDEPTLVVLLNGSAFLAPVISLSDDSIDVVLVMGNSVLRNITIDNSAGGSDLVWEGFTFQGANPDILVSSPRFTGEGNHLRANKKELTVPVKTDLRSVYRSQRTSSTRVVVKNKTKMSKNKNEIQSSSAPLRSLDFILDNLNVNFENVTDAIPSKFNFTDGVTGNNIDDGGNDMYDGGNYIGTNLGGPVDYSDDVILSSSVFGSGGTYFTRKYDGLFVLAADMNEVSYFEITGNLGADGYGAIEGSILQLNKYGTNYLGFVKRVWAAEDPSVNHLIIIEENPEAEHEFAVDTDDDYHKVFNLNSTSRLYYLLYAGAGGGRIDDDDVLILMDAFLEAVDPVQWLRLTPESGTIAAGASQNVELFLDGRLLSPADYSGDVIIKSNDPNDGVIKIPVRFKVLPPPIAPPVILSIADVPDDQGGWVTLSWAASPEDDFFSPTPVKIYSIWLKNPFINGVNLSGDEIMIKKRPQEDSDLSKSFIETKGRKSLAPKIIRSDEEVELITLPARLEEAMSAGDEWIGIGSIAATQSATYEFLVHTLIDSNSSGPNLSYLKVSAHPENPYTYSFSEVESGYSVDNLVPGTPSGLLALFIGEDAVQLTWDAPVDDDFEYFRIFRSTESGFDPSGIEPYSESINTLFIDTEVSIDQAYYYILSAVDANENESEFSEEVSATIVGIEEGEIIPADFVLFNSFPNPFNPSTMIKYGLPYQADVTLIIYNLMGQEIMRWDEHDISAGYYSKTWNGTNKFGISVGSGMYVYRIIAGDFVQTRKMVLLK